MKSILIIFFLFGLFNMTFAQKMEVIISNISNNKGVIRLAIYTNEKDFSEEKAFKLLTFSKEGMKNGQLTLSIDLPKDGIFGLSMLDDENENAEMDYNFFGIPKEGYAFSNFFHTGYSMPEFNDFKFDASKVRKTYCKMRYL